MNVEAAREAARRPDGKFGEYARDEETGVDLTATRVVTIPATSFQVQDEPMLADTDLLTRIRPDGTITSVVAVDSDTWNRLHDDDERSGLLASTQVAHVDPHWLSHEVVAVHDGETLVEVTNNLHVWANDPEAVEDYNAEVAPGYAITPEKYAFLRLPGHSTPAGDRAVVDLDGYDTTWTSDGPMRVTPCCGASATGTRDGICCRACYEPVDAAIGMPARLVPKHAPALEHRAGWSRVESKRIADGVLTALQHAQMQPSIRKPTAWVDQVVVLTDTGRVAVYGDDAWEREPSEQGLLPRPKPPTGRVVAKVAHDGTVDCVIRALKLTGLRQRTDGRFEQDPFRDYQFAEHRCRRTPGCPILAGHLGTCEPRQHHRGGGER